MARAMGCPEWIDDPRFITHPDRSRNYAEMMSLVEAWTKVRTAAECEKVLMKNKVPCARYREVHELFDDAQLSHREAFTTVSDGAGSFQVPNPPFNISDTPVGAQDWIAPFGSSASTVLGGLLGLSEAEIATLFATGVLLQDIA
jgi:crotonobetainyl-CoA:carnitine CoA-transferase CaiB-like acyl-CoA transferase